MAADFDFELDQGADWVIPIELYDAEDKQMDLSGFTARMQIRASAGSGKVSDELTTENGRLSIEDGTITARWPNAVTTAMSAGRFVYDLEIVSAEGLVARVLEGNFILHREVTR